MRVLLLGLAWLGLLGAAPAASAAAPLLQYDGGPVAHSMNLYIVEWGSGVRSTYTDATTGDPGLFSYLASQSGTTTDIGGVLAQYMDSGGANSQNKFTYGGMTEITPPTSGGVRRCSLPSCVNDTVIQAELQRDITAKSLPAPTGNGLQTMYVVLFPTGTNVCDSGSCAYARSGFCAYHSSFSITGSTHALYAAIPDDGPGTPNAGACGSNPSDLANQTDVLSHEVSETVNDPLVAEGNSAWTDANGNEIADVCVSSTEQAPNGSFTVQKIWSNLDDNCVAGESAYSAPTATFLAGSTGTTGQPLSFDASGSADPSADTAAISGTSYSISSGLASYAWDWGDGTTSAPSNSASATHTYANSGNYEVSLTVTDNLGFTSTVTHEVSVSGPPKPPLVTTGTAASVDSQGATLNGTINPENQTVQYEFIYGTSPTALNQVTPLATGPMGDTATPVSAALTGLSPSTTYYYELEAVSGSETYTDDPPSPQSFTTSAPPPMQTPGASTGSATQISTTSAELSGAVNPEGSQPVTYWFAYGTSPTNLDLTTPQATEPGGSTPVPVSTTISKLSPGTAYYYALEVSLNGNSSSGAVAQFTTLSPAPSATPPTPNPPAPGSTASPTTPPSVTTGSPSHITGSGAIVSGAVNPNGVPTTYQVQFGTSTSYGYSSAPVSAGSGSTGLPVSVTLSGLKARTTYHYRFVASTSYATVVGADETFTTVRALAPAPRFSFRVLRAPALPVALRDGLRVRFTCSQGCVARFSVLVLATSGALRVGGTPLSVASGSRRLRSKGSATALLRFSARGRNRLRSAKVLRLSISGVAVGTGTAPSPPVLRRLTLS